MQVCPQCYFCRRKKPCTQEKKSVQAELKKINLLVDIQAKLQAGKSAGYARWAKVFNLKKMAKTINYRSEHGLLEYATLATLTKKIEQQRL